MKKALMALLWLLQITLTAPALAQAYATTEPFNRQSATTYNPWSIGLRLPSFGNGGSDTFAAPIPFGTFKVEKPGLGARGWVGYDLDPRGHVQLRFGFEGVDSSKFSLSGTSLGQVKCSWGQFGQIVGTIPINYADSRLKVYGLAGLAHNDCVGSGSSGFPLVVSASTNNFHGQIGAGVTYDVTPKFRVGLGVEHEFRKDKFSTAIGSFEASGITSVGVQAGFKF